MSASSEQRTTSLALGEANDGVAVVQDTHSYLTSTQFSKARDTRWVRGLSPEDELNEIETRRAWEQRAAAQANYGAAMGGERATGAEYGWLRRPVVMGAAYVFLLLAITAQSAEFEKMMTVDFPEDEESAAELARRSGEGGLNFFFRVGVPLLFPSALGAVCAGWLTFILGSAGHHFTTLCGVGTAALSVMAATTQVVMLWSCAGHSRISNRWESDVPYVFYLTCSVARAGCPLLAMWCATPLVDMARRTHYLKLVLAVPLVFFVLALGLSILNEERLTWMFKLTHVAVQPTWAFLLCLCWRLPAFTVVVREIKVHDE